MGLVTGKYSPEEEQFILENYETMSIQEIAEELNRGYMSVSGKYQNMGLSRRRPRELTGGFEPIKIEECLDKFHCGTTYHVKIIGRDNELSENYHMDYYRDFIGELVKKTDELLVFDRGHFKECIKVVDVVRNSYQIEEVL